MTNSQEKVCLITGCSSGLGIALAVDLAQRGHIVIATMRNLSKDADLRAALSAAGVQATIERLDTQDSSSIQSVVNTIIAKHQRIDVLINNAGVGCLLSTENAPDELISQVLDINVHGVMRCTKAVIPHMRAARQGHVVNISSLAGQVGQPFNEIYCASKFAIEGYTEALAAYMTPAFGINFTSVVAGRLSTDFAANAAKLTEGTTHSEHEDYKPTRDKYVVGAQQRAQPEMGIIQSATTAAKVVTDCIHLETPPIRIFSSKWVEDMCRIKIEPDPTGQRMQQAVINVFLENKEVSEAVA